MNAPIACCPYDGAPLIQTLAFSQAEFYCLDCGSQFDWITPTAKAPTPELAEQLRIYEAEWKENAAPRMRVGRWWMRDCEKCTPHGEYHCEHATDEERAEHAAALRWLRERARQAEAA